MSKQSLIPGFFKSISFSSNSSPIRTVAITGSTGLVGTKLVNSLESKGVKVVRFVRSKSAKDTDIFWDPSRSIIENPSALEGVDAVINLAGENVGSGDGPLAFLGMAINLIIAI